MSLKTKRLARRGQDLAQRANVEWSVTGPSVTFSERAEKIISDLFIDFQARYVLYAEGEFEIPEAVERSLQEIRGRCVEARQALAGNEPALSEPLDLIAQACGKFVSRHPATPGVADISTPLSDAVLADLFELRIEIAEVVERVYRETGLRCAQDLLNRIEFRAEPSSPWPGYSAPA